MKPALPEHICCVRRLFVQVKSLEEHLHCVRRLFVQVIFLAEHLHCVLRTQAGLLVTSCSLTPSFTVSEENRHSFRRNFGKISDYCGIRRISVFFRIFFGKILKSFGNRIQAVDPVSCRLTCQPASTERVPYLFEKFSRYRCKCLVLTPYQIQLCLLLRRERPEYKITLF